MQKGWLVTDQNGFLLVEAMLSSALFALLVTVLAGAYLYGQESSALAGNRARAALFAEEGLEAARNIRDSGYANLTDGMHGLAVSASQWDWSGSQDTSGIFTRQIIISSLDAKRKGVTANVTWQQNPHRTGLVSLATRLTKWLASSIGNWAAPIQEASIAISSSPDGAKVQVSGNYAYVIQNNGTPDFLVIDIANPLSPFIAGSLNLTGTPTNIAVSGDYAYVSSADNSQELQIIDISSPFAPSMAGTFNAAGTANATGVYVVGSMAYLVRVSSGSNEFIIVNVTVPSAPLLAGSLNLGANANEVAVAGNYAYVASDSNNQELQAVDIAVPALPVLAGSLNLSGSANASTLAIAGTVVLLGRGNALYTINIATPASPSFLGSISTSGALYDIALNLGNGNTYAFLATSDTAAEFQVVDIATPATPSLLGFVGVSTSANLSGIAYDETLDRAVGASASTSAEFFVFAPQ